MPAIQVLKKKLRGIQSTQKISKAMKTVSSIKISQLTAIYNNYREYDSHYENIYDEYKSELLETLPPADPKAPVCIVVFTSNKGLCGGFNSDLLSFAEEEIKKSGKCVLIACGKKAIDYFNHKHIDYLKSFVFGDVPDYEEANLLLNDLMELRKSQKISSVKVIYQKYVNMMRQTPCVQELFCSDETEKKGKSNILLIPDKQKVIESIAPVTFQSIFYKLILEVALGAHAATLMTMRSAYDTATEYCMQLESEINRQRQSAVTADVIETASEHNE